MSDQDDFVKQLEGMGIPVFDMSDPGLLGKIEDAIGGNHHNMRRDRPYTGQPWTHSGIRGATEIKGITFRDLRDCYIRAILLATGGFEINGVNLKPRYKEALKGEDAVLCENDIWDLDMNKISPTAIANALGTEIEKIMGIFPNLPEALK